MTSRGPVDHDIEQAVTSWLKGDDEPTADRNRQIGRIMGRVDETRQRRRLWPLNPFGRRAMHSATDGDGTLASASRVRGMVTACPPLWTITAVVTLLFVSTLLLYVASQAPSSVPGGAGPATVDELIALNSRAWSGESELLGQTYASDGVHTATFYDRTNEYVGPQRISMVAGLGGGPELIGPRIDLPAPEGEWRWVDLMTLGGGTACLWHAVDRQIVRHDCLVPEYSYEIRPAAAETLEPDTLAAIAEIQRRLDAAWGPGASAEALEAVYAPDAVHSARYLDATRTYTGPDEILAVAQVSGDMGMTGDPVAFTAPEGELAWAQVMDLDGGSVCLFRARNGMVFRHDCLLPIALATSAPDSSSP